jgi:hypothetical protein
MHVELWCSDLRFIYYTSILGNVEQTCETMDSPGKFGWSAGDRSPVFWRERHDPRDFISIELIGKEDGARYLLCASCKISTLTHPSHTLSTQSLLSSPDRAFVPVDAKVGWPLAAMKSKWPASSTWSSPRLTSTGALVPDPLKGPLSSTTSLLWLLIIARTPGSTMRSVRWRKSAFWWEN